MKSRNSIMLCFRGLTKPQQQKHFRETNPIKLKRGIAAVRTTAQLPSDADPYHTYGCLPAFRSMEMICMMGYCSEAHARIPHLLIPCALRPLWHQSCKKLTKEYKGHSMCTSCAGMTVRV